MLEENTADVSADAPDTSDPQPVTIVETPETSIEDDLSAVWDKAHEDGDDGEDTDEGQPRGPDGKFAKRDGDEGDDTEQAAAEEGSEEESEADQPEDEAANTPVEAPESWPAEMRERFQALPPEFRDVAEFAAQREHEQGDAIDKVGQSVYSVEQQLMQLEPFEQVAQAYKEDLDRRGVHPAQAFNYLLSAQRTLDQNPLGGIVQLARSYNIDLMPLLQQAGVQVPQTQQAPQAEPYVQALQHKVQQLEGMMTAHQQQQYQAEEQRLNALVEDFAKDKPYFDEVRPVMAALLSGKQAEDLATAYDMAINASPKTRTRIQQDAQKDIEAKRVAEQKAKADKARKSTAVNVKSGTANSATPKTMDDTISAAYDAAVKR